MQFELGGWGSPFEYESREVVEVASHGAPESWKGTARLPVTYPAF
jgi:hypothetical protein